MAGVLAGMREEPIIEFQKINLTNLDEYAKWIAPDKKHHLFNGPYYKKKNIEEHGEYIQSLKDQLKEGIEDVKPNYRLAVMNGKMVGACSWYWKSEETNWLEIGIIVYDDQNWGKGIGSKLLRQWIDIVFAQFPQIIRIGLTTWSGNIGMVKLSEKLGLKQEACYRKARIVNGKYYDSVSYGILREEWEEIKK